MEEDLAHGGEEELAAAAEGLVEERAAVEEEQVEYEEPHLGAEGGVTHTDTKLESYEAGGIRGEGRREER